MATTSAKSDPTPDAEAAEKIDSQLNSIRAELAALAATLTAYGKEKAEDLRATAEALTEEATIKTRETISDLRSEADRLEEALEARVKEKPLQSLLMAFGLGVLVSLFLRR